MIIPIAVVITSLILLPVVSAGFSLMVSPSHVLWLLIDWFYFIFSFFCFFFFFLLFSLFSFFMMTFDLNAFLNELHLWEVSKACIEVACFCHVLGGTSSWDPFKINDEICFFTRSSRSDQKSRGQPMAIASLDLCILFTLSSKDFSCSLSAHERVEHLTLCRLEFYIVFQRKYCSEPLLCHIQVGW